MTKIGNRLGRQFAGSLLAIGSVLMAGQACAQEASGGAESSDTGSSEIVVTAQRRSELSRDVPVSISTVSQEALSKSGVNATSDLARVVPGLEMPFQGTFMQPAIRGVTSTVAGADSSNVAFYLDGVYQAAQAPQLFDLPDVQQIDVLKGPQGTLYGQNATGGAILIKTMTPSFTTTGKFSASYGNFNDVDLRGYISGPLSSNLAFSVAGSYRNHDGYLKNILLNRDDGGLDSKLLRGKLLFKPSDAVSITATGFWVKRTDSAQYSGVAFRNNSLANVFYPNGPITDNPRETAFGSPTNSQIETYGGSLRADITVGPGVLSSISAYSRSRIDFAADVDYAAATLAEVTVEERQHAFTQELLYTSDKIGILRFTLGGFFLKSRDQFPDSLFNFYLPPALPPAPPGTPLFSFPSSSDVRKTIFAGFGEATVDLTDKLIATAGARYTSVRTAVNSGKATGSRPQIFSPTTFKKVTLRANLRYALTSTSNVYASFTQGFKDGILSAEDVTQPPIKPENITSFEVGYKGRLFDGLSLNLAAFNYRYRNLQVARYEAPVYVYQNAATAKVNGAEAELVANLTPGLEISGSVAFLDANYRSFPAAGIFVPSAFGGNDSINFDASGRRMIRAPKFTASLRANYSVDTSIGRVTAFGSVYHNSGSNFEPLGRLRQPAYTLIDGEIALSPAELEKFRFVLWGKNLTNKAYINGILQSVYADGVTYASPRTYGVRAEFEF